MGTWKKKYLWICLLVLKENSAIERFLDWKNHCMVWSNLLRHGLRDLLSLCSNLAITKTKEIILFSTSNHLKRILLHLLLCRWQNLRYFLGIEVARSKRGIYVTQKKYILDLLNETKMLGCKPTGTPINQNHQLGAITEGILVEKGRYQKLVGRLIYLSHTRPNIAYVVSMVSQFMHSP